MKASYFAELAEKDALPKSFQNLYRNSPELKSKFVDKFERIPWAQ